MTSLQLVNCYLHKTHIQD